MRSFCAACIVLLSSVVSSAADRERPNVLLITVDDMHWDSVGAFGCPLEGTTPNIDRLASQGMRLERGYVTIAICMPTRAVWMTGRYPHRSGALGFTKINPGVPTLVESLHDAGYMTGLMAKEPHVVPTRHAAFDVIVPAKDLANGRDPEAYGAKSKEFFARAKATDKPFFLMANTQDPHRPFAGSDQEAGRRNPLQRKNQRQKQRAMGGYPDPGRTYSSEEVPLPGFLPDLPEVRQELAEYFGSVYRADESVGAVLKSLEEAGLAEKTLVMFLSDHGMPLPFAKTNCYEASNRTPWIVRWPGVVKPGSVDETHFVSGIDLAPTILDAVGLPNLDRADGRSALPVLKGETQSGRDVVFTHINTISSGKSYPMRGVRTERFGYIFNAWADGETVFRNESQAGRTFAAMNKAAKEKTEIAERVELFVHRVPEEFYDYEKDPNALNNLIDDPAYAEEVARHRKLLEEQMRSTDDPQSGAFEELLRKRAS